MQTPTSNPTPFVPGFRCFNLAFATLLAASTLACASDVGSYDSIGEGGSSLGTGVGQGGAQDFGLFREILLAGDIPGPETIDDLGFFAEHQIETARARLRRGRVHPRLARGHGQHDLGLELHGRVGRA